MNTNNYFAKDKIKGKILLKIKGSDILVIKQIAWNTFKNTGNINTFLELKQIGDIEQNITKVETYETIKSKGSSNCGKNSIRF